MVLTSAAVAGFAAPSSVFLLERRSNAPTTARASISLRFSRFFSLQTRDRPPYPPLFSSPITKHFRRKPGLRQHPLESLLLLFLLFKEAYDVPIRPRKGETQSLEYFTTIKGCSPKGFCPYLRHKKKSVKKIL